MTDTITRQYPTTEFGQPVLDDMLTSEDWWSLRYDDSSDVRQNSIKGSVVLAAIVSDEPARTLEVAEPDFYDDGRAYWLTADAVVSVEAGREHLLVEVKGHAKRLDQRQDGWTRIHPSHYGVDVDSFHDGPCPAHDAWTVLDHLV